MIGIKYMNSNSLLTINHMTTIPPIAGSDGTTTSNNNNRNSTIYSSANAARRPSLLRNQLLRRTTTRMKKRLSKKPPVIITVEDDATVEVTAGPHVSEDTAVVDENSDTTEMDSTTSRSAEEDDEDEGDNDENENDSDSDCDESEGTLEKSDGSEDNDRIIIVDVACANSNAASLNTVEDEQDAKSGTVNNEGGDNEEENVVNFKGVVFDIDEIDSVEGDEEECKMEEEPEPKQPQQSIQESKQPQPKQPQQLIQEPEPKQPQQLIQEPKLKQPQQLIQESKLKQPQQLIQEPELKQPQQLIQESKQPQPKQPQQLMQKPPPTTMASSTVSTTHLSIVVTGHDIVVEYLDDKDGEHKESSYNEGIQQESDQGAAAAAEMVTQAPTTNSIMATLLSPLGLSPVNVVTKPSSGDSTTTTTSSASCSHQEHQPRRPKGIMKRPRDSNITYHHPRRPLPPPLPPPGFLNKNSSLSWSTENAIGGRQSPSISIRLKKRVSFDEDLLMKQYKMSQMRRQARRRDKRSVSGILYMAMPIILPYLVAVLILVASSMVPLPTPQTKTSTITTATPKKSRLPRSPGPARENMAGISTESKPPPIIIDIASRMWEERKKSDEELIAFITMHTTEIRNDDATDETEVHEAELEAAKLEVIIGNESDSETNLVGEDDTVSESNSSSSLVAITMMPQTHAAVSKRKNPVRRAMGGLFRRVFRRRRKRQSEPERLAIAGT